MVGGELSFVSIQQFRAQRMVTFTNDAREVSGFIAAGIVNHVYFLNVEGLHDELDKAVAKNDIESIHVNDRDGKILAEAY